MGVLEETYTLKMKDIDVLRFNLSKGMFQILNELYLPYQLKGAITVGKTSQECFFSMVGYLGKRVLPLSRENAKKILNALRMSQSDDMMTKTNISLSCSSVTLQDNYWVCQENDRKYWRDVDIRQNRLSKVMAQIALHGTSLSIQGKIHTPEVSTNGAYAKCWKRDNGDLYLYKRGYRSDLESKIEVCVSKLLDKTNVPHVKYSRVFDNGVYCCKCKCMTDDTISILPADDFIAYCSRNLYDWKREVMCIDSDMMYKMFIVDYLISNSDRHNINWGFLYNSDTMQILGCHPLYDHNNAFDKSLISNENSMSLVIDGSTMRSLAVKSMERTDFHFKKRFSRFDFISSEHYKSFMKRSEYLGVEIRNG